MTSDWVPHRYEDRPWAQTVRGGSRADRTLTSVRVALPPLIAGREVPIDGRLAADLELAMREISALERGHGDDLGALSTLLLRSESVASSKIEAVDASIEDYARALHGSRANASAVSMVAATGALQAMIDDASAGDGIRMQAVLTAHAALMAEDPAAQRYAGQLRDMQNWIGGSDHSPRGALFVPPPPETVPSYLADLMDFANRDDLPALAQAAIAHAQFESIHPFTDGNGRIGRALINAVLRRRGATTRTVVPLATALVAARERYFGLLDDYRAGNVRALMVAVADAARISAVEAQVSAERLSGLGTEWLDMLGGVRAGSAAMKVLALLTARPIFTADELAALVDAPRSSVYAAVDRLRRAGVIRPLTDRQRDQVWGAGLVLDELHDLGVRAAEAMRTNDRTATDIS